MKLIENLSKMQFEHLNEEKKITEDFNYGENLIQL